MSLYFLAKRKDKIITERIIMKRKSLVSKIEHTPFKWFNFGGGTKEAPLVIMITP